MEVVLPEGMEPGIGRWMGRRVGMLTRDLFGEIKEVFLR